VQCDIRRDQSWAVRQTPANDDQRHLDDGERTGQPKPLASQCEQGCDPRQHREREQRRTPERAEQALSKRLRLGPHGKDCSERGALTLNPRGAFIQALAIVTKTADSTPLSATIAPATRWSSGFTLSQP